MEVVATQTPLSTYCHINNEAIINTVSHALYVKLYTHDILCVPYIQTFIFTQFTQLLCPHTVPPTKFLFACIK